MILRSLIALGCAAGLCCAAQTAANLQADLPKDPSALLAAAAPFYDFSDPVQKPWHLKATYLVYDDKVGTPQEGNFEYWWESPQVYRATWTRGSSSHTDWHTGEGKRAYRGEGEPLKYFEYKLKDALLAPLPKSIDPDPAKAQITRDSISIGSEKLPCVMVSPKIVFPGRIAQVPLGLFPTYCFDTHLPALVASYALGGVTTAYGKIAKMQNHFLAREVVFSEGNRKLLSATVDSVTGLNHADAALTPPPGTDAASDTAAKLTGETSQGMLLKKEVPVYPLDAKEARVSGTVLLQATIGTDGGIHELQVLSAPWPSLAISALRAVSHWQYKPYRVNGTPAEVETKLTVIFTLGD